MSARMRLAAGTMVAFMIQLWLNPAMQKTKAIHALGGVAEAARRIGCTQQAVNKWPDELPPRIADRVLAAIARERLPDLASELAAAQAANDATTTHPQPLAAAE
jgi:hypothetical protein